jgi:hypothetical protein
VALDVYGKQIILIPSSVERGYNFKIHLCVRACSTQHFVSLLLKHYMIYAQFIVVATQYSLLSVCSYEIFFVCSMEKQLPFEDIKFLSEHIKKSEFWPTKLKQGAKETEKGDGN